ncbi:precorrin-2 C(20)-methyltransferase [Labilibaculum filiforme]|uniref:Precorrin-2 C(20)-methyltransferase n=1 Tax=Labilibaculum filiforme TaxID=1940526 RepID=A0A2N3HVA3_9BACT|nr:precorrin-2 C(20)-methyltransferase [Labilibaculum filiforme]PKQ62006.1 precorrin-2 C(20)-methyltransferase [Labilibaculum filiforme]
MQNRSGKVFGVALGPGDPELITLKALNCLKKVDKIYYPATETAKGSSDSFSLVILKELNLEESRFVPITVPMSKDRSYAEKAYAELFLKVQADAFAGKQVAIVSEGDISFFSTFSYLLDGLNSNNIDFEMIPGVPAFVLGGSVGKLPLCTLKDKLLIVPDIESEEELQTLLSKNETVVLMKISKVRNWIKDFIKKHDMKFFYGEYLGTEKQFSCADIKSLEARRIPYFAIIIFYGNNRPLRPEEK